MIGLLTPHQQAVLFKAIIFHTDKCLNEDYNNKGTEHIIGMS